MKHNKLYECSVCHKKFGSSHIIHADIIRDTVAQLIKKDISTWDSMSNICDNDLHHYQNLYVNNLLETDQGNLTELEKEVINNITNHELISTNLDKDFDTKWTLGERVADKIASFGGSWAFMGVFAGFLLVWITINSMIFLWNPVDPFPYILLNLVLSCLAAIQAPIIMMSQNRQEAKDRVRSQHDYQVNLKAELEIRQLNEKIDHLLYHQWEKLTKIEEIQLDVLEELRLKKI